MYHFKNLPIIALFLTLLVYSSVSSAYYFAYIPDQASDDKSKYLHVVNTSLNLYVDKILLSGTPRDVALNNGGDYVYVSGVITEGSNTVSKINVISTRYNSTVVALTIKRRFVRGLTLSSDDSVLYVTHEDGITRIDQPTYSYIQTHLDLTYRGTSLMLSDDDKYLFVIGTDGTNNEGVSIVDVSQELMLEVATYSLGADMGANAIVIDNALYDLYVVTTANHPTISTQGGQLIKLNINNYNTDSIELTASEAHVFPRNSFPIDVALNPNKPEIYVALSYIDSVRGYGDGLISILALDNLSGSSVADLNLSTEGGTSSREEASGSVYPLSIAFDDEGKFYAIKQLWNEYPGTYVSSFDYYSVTRSGDKVLLESEAVNLGKRSSSPSTGKFIGANCTSCPNGIVTSELPTVPASALSPFMILFSLLFLYPIRRLFATKI